MDTVIAAGVVEVAALMTIVSVVSASGVFALKPLRSRRIAVVRFLRQGATSLSAVSPDLNFEGGMTVA